MKRSSPSAPGVTPAPGMSSSVVMVLALITIASLAGCTTPPSVSPLLRVAEQAMRDEADRLDADALRDAAAMHERRAALAAAFDADLAQRDALDPQWVRDAAEVYAQAREALARHEAARADERARRAGNLHLAADATRRARELIDRQDRLVIETVGLDVWRVINGER